ncbi:hypothetical protein SAMN04489765_0167 [Tsukamurella pulmonis]|uniref:Uncharacterized protein n=1 Tax=Tsukamurella pulmonis TaxID=47312 RepID=A0A1H1ACY2_9ACTN|nr:hypothetical protein [Tsukamurella pulmonis]SDQ37585.1 hypothetical protein SAMN04489765_0167 [Tsukamurella pulmonis]SUQ39369.1 Uncharacterised protein [Tsukamurella pulmonis]
MFEVFMFSREEWQILGVILGCALVALRLGQMLRVQSFALVKASLAVSFVVSVLVI